jgi:hypothetical protein
VKKTLIGVLIAAATTISTAGFAQPQSPYPGSLPPPPSMPEPPPPPQAPAPSYTYAPPAPAATVAMAAPAGQWVYTDQYGWIWMPYDADYTSVAGPDVAYTFVYRPRLGWRWVTAPWVLGLGPTPSWGRLGPAHFAWYGHPGFRGRVVAHGGWQSRPAYRAPARVAWRGPTRGRR